MFAKRNYASRFLMQQLKVATVHALVREYEARVNNTVHALVREYEARVNNTERIRYDLIARIRTDDIVLSPLPWARVSDASSSSSTRNASRTLEGSRPSEPPSTSTISQQSTLYHCAYCSHT